MHQGQSGSAMGEGWVDFRGKGRDWILFTSELQIWIMHQYLKPYGIVIYLTIPSVRSRKKHEHATPEEEFRAKWNR